MSGKKRRWRNKMDCTHMFQQKLIFHHILIMQLDIFKVIRETTGNHSLDTINASCFLLYLFTFAFWSVLRAPNTFWSWLYPLWGVDRSLWNHNRVWKLFSDPANYTGSSWSSLFSIGSGSGTPQSIVMSQLEASCVFTVTANPSI